MSLYEEQAVRAEGKALNPPIAIIKYLGAALCTQFTGKNSIDQITTY
jgi:hypothetical protein